MHALYSARDLFSELPASDTAKAGLRKLMTEPRRHYHNLGHLDLLWSRHQQFGPASGLDRLRWDPLIACAIAFHDSVLEPGARDNEERSADLWWEVSARDTELTLADRTWVADTIRATADHLAAGRDVWSSPGQHARQWVVDLDLTPLGETADLFDRNIDALVAEGTIGSAAERRAHLVRTLRHYASAERLYRCPPIHAAFAEAANRNFSRHLKD